MNTFSLSRVLSNTRIFDLHAEMFNSRGHNPNPGFVCDMNTVQLQ